MRRRFFLLAAPAIVAAPSLMKVSALVMPPAPPPFNFNTLVTATIRARMPFLIQNIEQTNAIIRLARERMMLTEDITGIADILYGKP